MANSKFFSYSSIETLPIHLSFYHAEKNRKNKSILYIHGGGFVYGTAEDLPKGYLNQFLESGYDFISIEYPLAPEAKLDLILQKIKEAIEWFQKNYQKELGLTSNDYILFGRSAGAYLAIQAAHRAEEKPQALLLFYGYYSLQEASFSVPSRHYLSFPKVDEGLMKALTKGQPLVNGSKETRFAIYIYYRQSGTWLKDILNPHEQAASYSLTNSDLAQLPPAFLAASTGDPDIPYRISKKMAANIPHARLETVDSDEHDFDRTTTDSEGKEVYAKMIEWLANY